MNSHSDNSASSESSYDEPTYPRLNNTYDLIEVLGQGSTCKVWLARLVEDHSQQFAIKIMSSKFLKMKNSIDTVKKEIKIIQNLDHDGIIKLHEYGDSGIITSNSKLYLNQVFLVLEYVEGSLLFDLCKNNGAMGEDVGRFFLRQMIETMEYMNKKGVVHRDIKLENILVDKNMNLKFADFGFATNRNINALLSYRGTMSYMAPEIRTHKEYDGRQTDIFSMGVVLFTLVVGLFPFQMAESKDAFWKELINGQSSIKGMKDQYWKMVRGSQFSDDFKDLIQKILTENGNERLTLEQIKQHPFYNGRVSDNFQEFMRDVMIESQETGEKPQTCFDSKVEQINSVLTQQTVHVSARGSSQQI